MIFQTSFANATAVSGRQLEKPARRGGQGWFSFRSAFGAGVVAFNALVFLFIWLLPFTRPVDIAMQKLADPKLLYMLIPNNNMDIYFTVLLVQTAFTALMMFSFMLNKRASATYLSLPVSRARLFLSRYAAGLIMLVLPHIFSMSWLLYANVAGLGYSVPLIQGYAVMLGGAIVTVTTIYSIMAAICLCVGTVPEGLVFPVVIMIGLLFLPTLIISFCQAFLHGNAMNEYFSYLPLAEEFNTFNSRYMTLLPVFNYIFILDRFAKPSMSAEYFAGRFLWDGDRIGPVILVVWAVLSVVIAFLAYQAFKRYKAENSGYLGACRPLNAIAIFILVLIAFSSCLSVSGVNIGIKLLLAVAFSLAMFILCSFLLTLNLRKALALKSFRQYGGMLAILSVISVVCLTGWFGYRGYQPKPDEIESAYLSYNGAPDFISGEGVDMGNYYMIQQAYGESPTTVRDYQDLLFTDKNDIRTILDLHKEMIDAGADLWGGKKQTVENIEKDRLTVKLYVRYNLKNGKTVDRLYKTIPAQVAMDLLRLDETVAIRERITNAMALYGQSENPVPVTVTDALFGNEIRLEAADNQALFAALQRDIDRLAMDEKYFPDEPARAVLSFSRLVVKENEDGSAGGIIANGTYFVAISGGQFDSVNPVFMPSTQYIRMFITDSYTETLAFLRDMGWLGESGIWEDTSTIDEMYVERYRIKPAYETQALYFRAYMSSVYTKHTGSLTVSPDDYGDMLRRARTHYYVAEGGYLLHVKTLSDTGGIQWTTLFLPEADAPETVKSRALK